MLTRETDVQAWRSLRWLSRGVAVCILLISLLASRVSLGQDLNRKVIARTAPTYPELAKRMHLSGKVKLEAVSYTHLTLPTNREV